jgi:flagellar basal body-associated protein FliL
MVSRGRAGGASRRRTLVLRGDLAGDAIDAGLRNIIVDVYVVLVLVAGCGLTALMYYNQRKARATTNSAQRQDAAGVSEVMTMR